MRVQHRLGGFLGLVALFGFTGCGKLPGRPTPADIVLKPSAVRDFAVIYGQNCAGCHGQDGRGNCSLALNNPEYLAIANDDVIRQVISRGTPGTMMPAFASQAGGTLTNEQIEVLVHEIRARWGSAGILQSRFRPAYASSEEGDPARGVLTYGQFCESCHGSEGKGTSRAGQICDPTFLALVSDQSLRTTIIAGRPDLGHPNWRTCSPDRPMTGRDVTDVVAWLSGKRSRFPGSDQPDRK